MIVVMVEVILMLVMVMMVVMMVMAMVVVTVAVVGIPCDGLVFQPYPVWGEIDCVPGGDLSTYQSTFIQVFLSIDPSV